MENTVDKLIHIGQIQEPKQGSLYVFLRQVNPHCYTWFKDDLKGQRVATSLSAPTIEEALRLAQQAWKNKSFRTVICGFRYSLPERDEHGTNALFYQMAASYASASGVYFDDELGHNCIVHQASQEAQMFLKKQ